MTPETSAGFEAIDFAENVLGIRLMPWQRWLLIHLLELNPDGTFRFRTVLVLVARQNGKTTLVQVLALWRMFVDGAALVIGTAQNLDVAEEAWTGAVEMAEGVPELASEIAAVDRTNGKKALRLDTGERYKVAAASRRGGRGLSGDLVVLDELREHQTWDAWGAVTKTTMARPRPQVACLSNAGDASSVVLAHLRNQALDTLEKGEGDQSLGIFEWSAPDGCDLGDRAAWAQANPALGYTIREEAIASALATDPEPVFRTEVLCQWVDSLAEHVIDPEHWAACSDPESQTVGPVAFAVDVSPERWTAISVAGRRADGLPHGEIIEHRRGTRWVTDRLLELKRDHDACAIVLDPAGPAGALLPSLEDAGLEVETTSAREMAQACGGLYNAATDEAFRHIDQPVLNTALAGAKKRPLGDAWAWDRKNSTDISPLVSLTLALWGWSVHHKGTDLDLLQNVW